MKRGATSNPTNRFETISVPYDSEEGQEPLTRRTQFLRDHSKTILTRNESPDVGFEVSVNAYRGCEHGCAYCYARPTHEYLGFSAGVDFESKIMVKENAAELLRKELASPRWVPQPIAFSGVTDCYQPAERHFRLTRACLEVMAEFRNPVVIITKNHLVTRDLDLLKELRSFKAVQVFVSVTTLDHGLCGDLEPRTSRPRKRLEAIRQLSEAGVPVGVMMAPIIPGLTEHEIPAVLEAARGAGATSCGYTLLRLPLAVAPLFQEWVEEHRPLAREKILGRIKDVRGGRLNDPNFRSRMRGEGPIADQIRSLFRVTSRRLAFGVGEEELSCASFRRTIQPGEQMNLL